MSISHRVVYIFFSLLLISLTVAGIGVAAPEHASAAALDCSNILQNSDMEGNTGWVFGMTPAQGGYTTLRYNSPFRSVRLGITDGPNVASFSSMRQSVIEPVGEQLWLRLSVFPQSQPFDGGDLQEILILDESASVTLRQLWSATSNAGVWQPLEFNISEFLGQKFVVYLNVKNNGTGGVTAMFVDDVRLELCNGAGETAMPTHTPDGIVTATPTPTPNFVTATPTPIIVTNTPTPTPTPDFVTATPTWIVVTNTPTPIPANTSTPIVVTNTPVPTSTPTQEVVPPAPTGTFTPVPPSPNGRCKECLVNTDFESWKGWTFGNTALKPGYTGTRFVSPVRSVLLGNDRFDRPNYISYSSVRQRATLPKRGYKTAFLEFKHYTISNGETGDYQELIILDGHSMRTLEVRWRVNRNDQIWREERFDMTRYLGKSIVVYLNVYNNGGAGRAAMYLDDVSLKICPGDVAASEIEQLPYPTPDPPLESEADAPVAELGTGTEVGGATDGGVEIASDEIIPFITATPTSETPATPTFEISATPEPPTATPTFVASPTPPTPPPTVSPPAPPQQNSLLSGSLNGAACLCFGALFLILAIVLLAVLRRRNRNTRQQ